MREKQGDVLQSYICLLGLHEASAHCRIGHTEIHRDLSPLVAVLQIGLVNDLALLTSPLKQHA
jgi:hypothetical protein